MVKYSLAYMLAVTYVMCNAQNLVPDPTFGNAAGTDTFNYLQVPLFGACLAFQPDNKILITTSDSLNLGRLNSDGTVDATFGNNGWVSLWPLSIRSLVLQPDGKIVGAGLRTDVTYGEAYIWRFSSNGIPDSTFGVNGRVVDTLLGSGPTVALRTDGQMIVGGGFAITRLTSTGSIDITFGNNGHVQGQQIPVSMGDIVVDSATNNILIGGLDTNSYIGIARLTPNGAMDNTFGHNGVQFIDTQGNILGSIFQLAFTGSGKIIMATDYAAGAAYSPFCIRFNANGTPDSTFGYNGIAYPFNETGVYFDFFGGMVLQGGELPVIAHWGDSGSVFRIGLVRLTGTGIVDPTFNAADLYNSEDITCDALGMESDGKLVLVGDAGNDFLVARYADATTAVQNVPANAASVAVYPNPATNQTTLQLTTTVPDELNITLYDLQGRLLTRVCTALQVPAGTVTQMLPLNDLGSGIYVVSVKGRNTAAQVMVEKL